MPITVSHQLSMTTPDNPAYENRPSHWNQSHAFTANMAGSEISGAFSNANGLSFGLDGAKVTGSYTVPSTAGLISAVNLSAGTTNNNATAFTFGNAGGVTFGMNGGVITASAPAAGGGLTNIRVSAGTTSNLLSAITFNNGNGITFGLDASTITASHNAITSQSNQAVSAANGSFTFQTLPFADSNGVSWSTGTQGLFATVKTDYLTTARASNDAVGLNTAQSNVTWTVNSNGLSLDARGYAGTGTSATNASVTLNSNGLAISVAAPGGGGNFSAGVSNLGNTGGDTGVSGTRLVLVGSQNITLNQATDANGLTVSFSGGAGAAGNTGFISAGANTASLGTVVFSNSNGVSFGVNGQTVTASHNGITQQSTQPVAVSGQNGSYAFSTLSFSNANGISFGTSGGSAVTASYTVPAVTNSSWTVSDSATSVTVARLAFTNQNGVTLSLSTGAGGSHTIVGSHNGLISQSNQNITAANGGFAFQTLSFSNLNGISFGTAAGSAITASHNALTTARASTDAIGLNTAQTNVTWTVNSNGLSLNAAGYAGTGTSATNASITLNSNGLAISVAAGGGVNPAASASNGSFNFTTLAFSNANNVTFGTSAGGIITASVAPPGAAAENNAINLLGANTAGNTTATGSTIGWSGINLTLSGTNNSVVNISAPAVSSLAGVSGVAVSTNGSTISVYGQVFGNWEPIQANNATTFSSLGQNSLYLQKISPNANYSFNNIEFRASGSFVSSTNSQAAVYTIGYGLYSKNGATFSSLGTSQMVISATYNSNTAMGFTVSQGAGSYTTTSGGTAIASLLTGFKHLYLPFTSTISAGVQYAVGIKISSATSVNTGPLRLALLNQTIVNNLTIGKIHASTLLASNASFVGDFNQAVGSVTTAAMPSSIAESALTNAVSQARLYLQLDA